MIRSPINGSKGPRFENSWDDWATVRGVLADYPAPFEDLDISTRSETWHRGETVAKAETIFHGGLLQVRLRYYDADEARPGLPADVAPGCHRSPPRRRRWSSSTRAPCTRGSSSCRPEPSVSTALLAPSSSWPRWMWTARTSPSSPPGRSVRLALDIKRYCYRPSYSQAV